MKKVGSINIFVHLCVFNINGDFSLSFERWCAETMLPPDQVTFSLSPGDEAEVRVRLEPVDEDQPILFAQVRLRVRKAIKARAVTRHRNAPYS